VRAAPIMSAMNKLSLYDDNELVIVLMMEAVRTSETSVYFKETIRHYIPEGSNIYTRRRENLKSHIFSR
jgi:hypothetical protein